MKKTIAFALSIMMIAIVTVTSANAVLRQDTLPKFEQPESDSYCRCDTDYCECMNECTRIGLISGVAKIFCEIGCEAEYGTDIKWTCYPKEPTPYDIYMKCLEDCSVKVPGDRLYCIDKCGGM